MKFSGWGGQHAEEHVFCKAWTAQTMSFLTKQALEVERQNESFSVLILVIVFFL